MGESLRENLEAAFDEDSESSESEAQPVVDESPPVVEEPVVDEAPSEGAPPEGGESEGEAAGEAASDDSAGEQEEVKEESVVQPDEAQAPVQTGLKAPFGWKPAMREKFHTLDEDVQREVLRREVDIAKGMEIAADARRFKEEFDKHVAPYQAEIASRGVTPMDAFDNYLQTAYKLRHAPPAEKAELVAGLIQQYGVDVNALDTSLTRMIEQGGVPGNGAMPDPNVAAAVQQAMAPYQQMLEAQQQNVIRTAEQTQVEVRSEIQEFQAKPENEFFDDVKMEMASFLEAAAMRNQQMTLQEAYDRAILLRPDLAEIVSQRKLQNEAQARDQAAKDARAKAVGVAGGSPDAGGNSAQPKSLRGAIEAAFEQTDL